MNTKKDLVNALFEKNIRDKAKEMFLDNFEFNGFKDRYPIDIYNISFRLFKPTSQFVNLEVLISSNVGRYFQPIGLYDSNNNIYLLNEYVPIYDSLGIEQEIKKFKKIIDVLIAAFSMQTVSNAQSILSQISKKSENHSFLRLSELAKYDKLFESNGFECELLMSNEGYPQFYIKDDDEIKDAIGAYIPNEQSSMNIHPILEYKDLFEQLHKLKLLTAFNRI